MLFHQRLLGQVINHAGVLRPVPRLLNRMPVGRANGKLVVMGTIGLITTALLVSTSQVNRWELRSARHGGGRGIDCHKCLVCQGGTWLCSL
jgi:hypothetical protein